MRVSLLLLALLLSAAPGRAQSDVPIEAEGGTLTGAASVATARAGYSGAGYVTALGQPGDSLAIAFEGTGDFVQLRLAVAGDSRFGSYEARLDGEVVGGGNVTTSSSFRELVVDERRLSAGTHVLTIHGTFDVDYLVLTPTAYEGPALPPPVLSDPDATPATEALFAFLLDIYGEHVLAGQQDGYQNGGPSTREIDYVTAQTGKEPAVGAFDLINYSPSRRQYGANPTGWAEHWIDWAGTDGIVTLMWHWNAPTDLLNTSDQPWWRGFYTEATTFDVEAALAEGPGGENYDLLLRDIDAIAVELQKFEDADVPVLWRPLHEAYGGWFWWGAKGPASYVALWRLMYERLVDHHGLHNLIWVHTHRPEDGDQAAWYPGDDVVDIVGVDMYVDDPDAVFQSTWAKLQEQFGANKLAALTESGTLPDMTRSVDFGVTWSWFAIWEGDFIRDLDPDRLTDVYTSEAVLTRDELPDWRSYVLATATDDSPTADFDRLTLAPNPSAGRPTLRLDLGEAADVAVEVFDVTGRSVLRRSLGLQPAGRLAVPLHLDSSGTYLVRVTAGDRVLRGRVAVAR